MFSQEQLATPVEGFTVQHAIVAIQVVDRVAGRGVSGSELAPLALLRNVAAVALEKATGVNYDQFVQERMKTQQASQAPAGETPQAVS